VNLLKSLQEIYEEFEVHLLQDIKPSIYFDEFIKNSIFQEIYPFKLLGGLRYVEQSINHHPEGNVWNHTMLVVDQAARSRQLSNNPRVFMWAALLHDLGKSKTTMVRKGKITAYNHDFEGEALASNFLNEFNEEIEFVFHVTKMVKWHMQILYVTKGMPYSKIGQMLLDVSLNEIALLSLCDRLGRGQMTKERINEAHASVKNFIKICESIDLSSN